MTEQLICPMAMANGVRLESTARCRRERCAWWDGVHGKCAIALIAERLDAITTVDGDLNVHVTMDGAEAELLETMEPARLVRNVARAAGEYRLIYSLCGVGTECRETSGDVSLLIALADDEEGQYDDYYILDGDRHLIYRPGLGMEEILDHAPAETTGCWVDRAGRWHRQPC